MSEEFAPTQAELRETLSAFLDAVQAGEAPELSVYQWQVMFWAANAWLILNTSDGQSSYMVDWQTKPAERLHKLIDRIGALAAPG